MAHASRDPGAPTGLGEIVGLLVRPMASFSAAFAAAAAPLDIFIWGAAYQ
jgi:hypothetical protein